MRDEWVDTSALPEPRMARRRSSQRPRKSADQRVEAEELDDQVDDIVPGPKAAARKRASLKLLAEHLAKAAVAEAEDLRFKSEFEGFSVFKNLSAEQREAAAAPEPYSLAQLEALFTAEQLETATMASRGLIKQYVRKLKGDEELKDALEREKAENGRLVMRLEKAERSAEVWESATKRTEKENDELTDEVAELTRELEEKEEEIDAAAQLMMRLPDDLRAKLVEDAERDGLLIADDLRADPLAAKAGPWRTAGAVAFASAPTPSSCEQRMRG